MKRCLLSLIILLASGAAGQDKPKLIGKIEFFGYAGIDINKLRAALPFHEQDSFIWETFVAQLGPTGAAVKELPTKVVISRRGCDHTKEGATDIEENATEGRY